MLAEQIRLIDQTAEAILLEPSGRNTAPAVALAALYALQHVGEDALLLVMPADHAIGDIEAFKKRWDRRVTALPKDF
jgi:Mannose-1-phosphate guanylyltransferase